MRVPLTYPLRLRKPHLAQHKYIISWRKCDVRIDRLGIDPWSVDRCIYNYYKLNLAEVRT